MNKAIQNHLKGIARVLPIVEEEISWYVTIKGEQMIAEMGEDGKDNKGNPIDPKHNYKVKKSRWEAINHYGKLKRYFKKFGSPGVQIYLKDLREHISELAKTRPEYATLDNAIKPAINGHDHSIKPQDGKEI